jgi:hypothetical protein
MFVILLRVGRLYASLFYIDIYMFVHLLVYIAILCRFLRERVTFCMALRRLSCVALRRLLCVASLDRLVLACYGVILLSRHFILFR